MRQCTCCEEERPPVLTERRFCFPMYGFFYIHSSCCTSPHSHRECPGWQQHSFHPHYTTHAALCCPKPLWTLPVLLHSQHQNGPRPALVETTQPSLGLECWHSSIWIPCCSQCCIHLPIPSCPTTIESHHSHLPGNIPCCICHWLRSLVSSGTLSCRLLAVGLHWSFCLILDLFGCKFFAFVVWTWNLGMELRHSGRFFFSRLVDFNPALITGAYHNQVRYPHYLPPVIENNLVCVWVNDEWKTHSAQPWAITYTKKCKCPPAHLQSWARGVPSLVLTNH